MKRYCYCILLILFVAAGPAGAKTWNISFGGVNGSPATGYSPASLPAVNVGDMIVWTGDFSVHPLSLVQSPPGAPTFTHVTTGPTFSYTIMVAGSYQYHCDIHFVSPFFMIGTFAASAAGVDATPDTKVLLDPIYPNPSVEQAMVHFILDEPAHVTLRVFDATGRQVSNAANEEMEPGFHMLTIDTRTLPSGSYQYVLQAGEAVLRRSAIVIK